MERTQNSRMAKDYEERLSSLLADGYCCRFDHRGDDLWFAKLKHMANGNSVELRANFPSNTLTQLTNHVLKHQHTYE